MSGLIGSLQNSSNALRVHSKGLEVAGKNLANINNRGYSKERVEIGDRGSIDTGIATESMGVEAMGLRQNRDALLDKSVMREITSTSSLEAAKKVLESAETALGQFLDRTKDSTSIQNATGANGGGISDAITDFFNAWESFSVKPNDVGEKQLLIAKAQILADKINATDKRLAQVQTDADAQIQTDVGIVNGLLAEIAKTNEYIAKAELVKPFSAVDLRDQRQAKLEELAQYIDVQFGPVEDSTGQPDPNGLGQIVVRSGTTILVDRKNVPGQTLNANGTAVGPFTYNSATKRVQHDPDGAIGVSLAADFSVKGKLQAQIDAAYVNTQTARSEIADLADQITNSVNNLYAGVSNANPQFFNAKTFAATPANTNTLNLQAGHGLANGDQIRLVDLKNTTGLEGSGLSEGGTYFVSSVVGNTIKLSATKNGDPVTITSALSAQSSFRRLGDSPMGTPAVTADALKASNTVGGNRIALDIAKLASKPFDTAGASPDFISGSYTSFFNKTVTTLGQTLNNTNIRLEDQKLSQEMALNNRDQYSGVSQDEEMTDMMKFQRSFQASARHINVIDTLLEQVVNRLGVG
jgi:flagellar hook-associated protein 1 FlgK